MIVSESEAIVLEAFAAVDSRDAERLKRVSHPEASFAWPESLQPSNFRTVQGNIATSWEEVWEPFQPLPEFVTRKMNPRIVASSGTLVTVLWHQRGLNRHGERLDCEVLGLYEVRDGLLYRAHMFYFDTAAVRKFLHSNDTKSPE
jgi:ketosteroid isomerase-like protein